RIRVDLHAHGVFLLAEHLYLGDAVDGRDALREVGLGVLVHHRKRQRVGGEGEEEDREIGGVDLAERGWRRHAGRQLARGGGNRRIHVLCGGVDVAVERELQRDARRPLARYRAHLVDAGDGGELLL